MTSQHGAGFTLIELSIVLVIIGLLAGGILVGRDLILAADVRAQVAQIEKLNTAANTFKLKFNCLPGDCAAALALGLTDNAINNGNGNGFIDEANEEIHFWQHLSRSSLIGGTFVVASEPGMSSPSLKLTGGGVNPYNLASRIVRGGVWLFGRYQLNYTDPVSVAHVFDLAPAWVLTSTTLETPAGDSAGVYNPTLSYMLDSKIDDGFPLQGSMISATGDAHWHSSCVGLGNSCRFADIAATTGSASPHSDSCIDDTATPAQYNMKNIATNAPTVYSVCMPVIKAQFQ